MLKITTFIFLTAVPALCFADNHQLRSSYYNVVVKHEVISKTPAWSPTDPNPPISARRAWHLADATRAKILPNNQHFVWELDSLQLKRDSGDRWYWLVVFLEEPQFASDGPPGYLQLMVLMDGTVPEPIRIHGATPRTLPPTP